MKEKETIHKPFDAAAYLDNNSVIAEYLSAAAEDPGPEVFVAALGHVAKARGIAQIAKDARLAAKVRDTIKEWAEEFFSCSGRSPRGSDYSER